jgi:hypothetical protein
MNRALQQLLCFALARRCPARIAGAFLRDRPFPLDRFDLLRLGLRGHDCMDWAVFSSARSSAERCEQLEAEESSERDSMASFAASQVKPGPSCHPRCCLLG